VPSEAPIAAPVETVAAVAPAEPAPPPPEPVKPAFGGIGYKNNPPPDYPTLAVRQGWQGTVLLRVRVLQSGAVESVEVVKSSGKKVLDDAAIHTVERWVFAAVDARQHARGRLRHRAHRIQARFLIPQFLPRGPPCSHILHRSPSPPHCGC
jgi:protein TonB